MVLAKKRSTSLVVYDIIDKKIKALDKGDVACAVYLDLSKAFDTVDHDILIKNYNNME